MKRKIIAAVLTLLSAGFAWQTFADSKECDRVCKVQVDACLKRAVEDNPGDEHISARDKAINLCLKEREECIQECNERPPPP